MQLNYRTKLKNTEKMCKLLFSKGRIYSICRTKEIICLEKKVKSARTLKVKRKILFVGKLKVIENAMRFFFLFIHYIFSYLNSKFEVSDLGFRLDQAFFNTLDLLSHKVTFY